MAAAGFYLDLPKIAEKGFLTNHYIKQKFEQISNGLQREISLEPDLKRHTNLSHLLRLLQDRHTDLLANAVLDFDPDHRELNEKESWLYLAIIGADEFIKKSYKKSKGNLDEKGIDSIIFSATGTKQYLISCYKKIKNQIPPTLSANYKNILTGLDFIKEEYQNLKNKNPAEAGN